MATIRINENDARYQDMVRMAREAMSTTDNAIIVARGEKNRKSGIAPITAVRDISFYMAHEMDAGLVYSKKDGADLLSIAVQNSVSGARIVDLVSFIKNDGNVKYQNVDEWEPDMDAELPLYILTRDGGKNGAGILFCNCILHKVWEKIGNYYLIPSSIHELIVYADTGELDRESVNEMIRQINLTQVAEEERLSNNAFYYDGKLNQ